MPSSSTSGPKQLIAFSRSSWIGEPTSSRVEDGRRFRRSRSRLGSLSVQMTTSQVDADDAGSKQLNLDVIVAQGGADRCRARP
jgi:hypothetical protein